MTMNSNQYFVAGVPVVVVSKILRPLLSEPIASKVREYSEKWGIPAQSVVNLALAEHFSRHE